MPFSIDNSKTRKNQTTLSIFEILQIKSGGSSKCIFYWFGSYGIHPSFNPNKMAKTCQFTEESFSEKLQCFQNFEEYVVTAPWWKDLYVLSAEFFSPFSQSAETGDSFWSGYDIFFKNS